MKNTIRRAVTVLALVLACSLLTGCFGKGKGAGAQSGVTEQDLEFAAAIGTNEALLADANNRKVLQELSDALDVFCGQGEIDRLVLYAFLRSRLGDGGGRLGYIFLLLDRFGGNINPSDYVQWGGISCKLRAGIKRGLELSKPPK
jgi:predicted small secreted protein